MQILSIGILVLIAELSYFLYPIDDKNGYHEWAESLQANLDKAEPFMRYLARYYDQHTADMIVFVIFFVLFPRDQSFYILTVICLCTYLNTWLKMIYQEPHLYYTYYPYVNAAFCGHVSGLSFGYPSYPIMLQVCVDSSLYLTLFHTSKNSNLTDKESE